MPHIHDKYDFTVSAFIVFNDQVLLIHHKKINKWLQPGGHVELDEDPEMALWREVQEETGFKRDDLLMLPSTTHQQPKLKGSKEIQAPHSINVHEYKAKAGHHHIDLRWYLRAKHNTILLNESEHNDIRWFSLEDIRRELGTVENQTLENAEIAIALAKRS